MASRSTDTQHETTIRTDRRQTEHKHEPNTDSKPTEYEPNTNRIRITPQTDRMKTKHEPNTNRIRSEFEPNKERTRTEHDPNTNRTRTEKGTTTGETSLVKPFFAHNNERHQHNGPREANIAPAPPPLTLPRLFSATVTTNRFKQTQNSIYHQNELASNESARLDNHWVQAWVPSVSPRPSPRLPVPDA